MDSLQMQVPSSSSSSGGTITATSVTVSSPALEASVTIVDAVVTATDRINITWGNCSQQDENHPSMGPIQFNAIPGSGQFTLEIYSGDQSMLYGVFKINYDRAA